MIHRLLALALVCGGALLIAGPAAAFQGANSTGVVAVSSDEQLPAPEPAAASRWPMRIDSDAGTITVFEPQLENFQGDQLSARAAVQVDKAGQQQPLFGAIWLQSRVSTDRVARTVQILEVNVTKSRFPGVDAATEQTLTGAIKNTLANQQVTLSLDQLLAMLQTVQQEQTESADLQTAPPKVVFRDHPTVKIQYDGTPKLLAVPNSKLLRVANTPFFVVLDPSSKQYYLKGGGRWFAAADPLGPFQDAKSVPDSVRQLADASDYTDPEKPIPAAQMAALEIITATEPTELIWTDGPPQMATIAGTGLLYYSNTDSDVFVQIDTQQRFVLLSGRWYTAPNESGPWTFVPPDKLPADFSRIPPNSDKGDVLAHVSGTQAAQDALADAQVPQTASVDRINFEQPDVEYDGDADFQPVEGSSTLTYAVNTNASIVCWHRHYYCCYNACWYDSPGANGPWIICTSVPSDIYLIPPSCPIYPVRFCRVYGYTPTVVYCGYLPGYVGCYVYHGCVVYGTGWHYAGWWGHRYYARPWTFGFAAHYNSYVGHWGFSFALATGSSRLWIGLGGNDIHAWDHRGPWFGYGGYRPVVVHNDVHGNIFRAQYLSRVRVPHAARSTVRTDIYRRNIYDRRTDVHVDVTRNINVHETVHNDIHETGNDIFTDRGGNVYRRTDNGWERHDAGTWKPAPEAEHRSEPKAAPHEIDLNREYKAREAGDARLKNYEKPAEKTHSEPSKGGKGH